MANCTTKILSSSLVIDPMVTTDSWCTSSCLKEVWKIIYSDVCFLFQCNLFLLKFYHFNILNFRQVQQKLSIPLGGADPLPWGIRLKVAIGAARGLSFLHDAENQVIYRDFKASNILLDSVYMRWLLTLVLSKLLSPLFLLNFFSHQCRSSMPSFQTLAWQKQVQLGIEPMFLPKSWAHEVMQLLNMLQQVRK